MIGRFLTRLIDAQAPWARPLGDALHGALHALFHAVTPVRDVLNGRWLAHPLHAAITDIPIGALLVTVALDVFGHPAAADVALVVTLVAMGVSIVSGLADYADTDGTARVRATVHATLMVSAQVLLVVSAVLRGGGGDRGLPVVLAIVAFAVITAGAYVGGDVAYVLGNMVNRHAWRGSGGKWIRLEVEGGGSPAELAEGVPTKAKLGLNTLALVRVGDRIHALHDTCAHAGGPLSGGRLVDGCLECPWHGSRFRLESGHVVHGPAVYDQPVYEVRSGESGWEGRRVR